MDTWFILVCSSLFFAIKLQIFLYALFGYGKKMREKKIEGKKMKKKSTFSLSIFGWKKKGEKLKGKENKSCIRIK